MREGGQRGEHTLVIPRSHLTAGKVDINLDVSSRLGSRKYTKPHIKFHNKVQNLFHRNKIVIPHLQHIICSPSQWHSSISQLCGKHSHLFEPYHSSLLFFVRLPNNSKIPSNPKLQEEQRPEDEQIKLTGKQTLVRWQNTFSKILFLIHCSRASWKSLL